MAAAAATGRNGIGFELETDFQEAIAANLQSAAEVANRRIRERLTAHLAFVDSKIGSGYHFKHTNRHYGFAVMTGQETDLLLNELVAGQRTGENEFIFSYRSDPSARMKSTEADPAVG